MQPRLGLFEFLSLLGTTQHEFPNGCQDILLQNDFGYFSVRNRARDALIVRSLMDIESGRFSLAGEKDRWDKGWAESRDAFFASGDIQDLNPKYIHPDMPLRLDQEYIIPTDPNFELNWYNIFREWLFRTWLKDYDTIYEFGCGSGFNVAMLAQMYPQKKIWGLDWSQPSIDIVNHLQYIGLDVEGRLFDFFDPDYSFKLDKNSAILTIGALEQTGDRWLRFLDYMLVMKPALCIHIEPQVDWYSPTNLIDYVGRRFLKKRKYWSGFPAYMELLEKHNTVEIIKQKRSYFGSFYVEGYSQFIWRCC